MSAARVLEPAVEAVERAHPAHQASPRPRPLRVVPPPAPRRRRPSRAPFVILMAALVAGGLVALLLLNTVLAQDSYALHSLHKETASLADAEQALVQQVAQDESPAALAARARELGLVPAPNPVFVRGADGTVLGVAAPAQAPPAEGEPAR